MMGRGRGGRRRAHAVGNELSLLLLVGCKEGDGLWGVCENVVAVLLKFLGAGRIRSD